jgi:hypothetical protein
MELKDLVGLRELSGVDRGHIADDSLFRDAKTLKFVLDGKTYTAIEDPNDGYRSTCRNLEVIDGNHAANRFPPQRVMAVMRKDGDYCKNNVLELLDTVTGKVVLSVGTENTNDYYPMCIMSFNPENMAINQK